MSRLRIITNPVDAKEGILHVRTDKVLETFTQVKNKHPQARIYIQPACAQNDVTPTNKVDEASLQMLAKNNDFDIVCQAGEAATIIAVVSLVVSLAMTVYTLLTMPKPQNGMDQSSANNQLGQRQNKARIGGRIPDIYGTVKAYPDLIAPPYRYYENDTEVEEILTVLGRGYYDVAQFKEGDTSITQIPSMSVSAYDPGMSITSSTPMYRHGDVLNYAPLVAKQSVSIVDRELPQPNKELVANDTMTFTGPNIINITGADFNAGDKIILDGAVFGLPDELLSGTTNLDFTNKVLTIASTTNIVDPQNFKLLEVQVFSVADPINGALNLAGNYPVLNIVKSGSYVYQISLDAPESVNQNWLLLTADNSAVMSANLTRNIANIDLDGEYTISTVEESKIILSAPDAINPDWLKIDGTIGGELVVLYGSQDNWQGWYESYGSHDSIIVNFYAPQGLYYIGKKGWKGKIDIEVALEYQQIDDTGAPIGLSTLQTAWLYGRPGGERTNPIGMTMKHDFSFIGNVRYRVRKVTAVKNNGNTNVHEVQAKTVFLCSKITKLAYDDVTIVRAKTINNDVSSGVKERMLNCIATRKLHSYATGTKSADRMATNGFADIVCAMTEDAFIGRRSVSELDVVGLYQTSNYIQSYFGTYKATEFNHTFDQANQSYEETLAQIASVVFCNARRESGKIYFQFERTNPSSSILFNHRNKKPGSETRTEKFGVTNEYDGVEVSWIDPDDSWTEKTLKLPDENITNPKKIELAGVTNKYQAHFLAHRAWNKIRYQRETVQFTAYGEADLITINDRIAVTDDTIPSLVPIGDGFTQGEVVEWVGQNIAVSQPVQLNTDQTYIIHLQLPNGSIETMQVVQGGDEWHLVLERLPTLPLVTSWDGKVAPTVYSITLSQNKDSEAYLVSEKSPSGTFESQITAINYDTRYYKNDSDYLNNLIT